MAEEDEVQVHAHDFNKSIAIEKGVAIRDKVYAEMPTKAAEYDGTVHISAWVEYTIDKSTLTDTQKKALLDKSKSPLKIE